MRRLSDKQAKREEYQLGCWGVEEEKRRTVVPVWIEGVVRDIGEVKLSSGIRYPLNVHTGTWNCSESIWNIQRARNIP